MLEAGAVRVAQVSWELTLVARAPAQDGRGRRGAKDGEHDVKEKDNQCATNEKR